MRSAPNPAVRRFAALWGLSLVWKLAALALLLVVVKMYLGGS